MFDLSSLVPPGLAENAVREYGPGIIKMGMRMAAAHFKLEPGERMVFVLAEHVINGEATVIALPMACNERLELDGARKFAYRNLAEDLKSAPVAAWLKDFKAAEGILKEIAKLQKEIVWQHAKGRGDKVHALAAEVKALQAKLPAAARAMDNLVDLMQPMTTRGAVEKPYSSAPSRAAITTSRPVFICPSA